MKKDKTGCVCGKSGGENESYKILVWEVLENNHVLRTDKQVGE
jgi:hypothetical protein